MISFQQIHYIIVLSEELQFQRASERCFVTQPTLSMQIKKAEETLGSIIFDRSRQPLELTEFGRELLPLLRDTLFELIVTGAPPQLLLACGEEASVLGAQLVTLGIYVA